MEFNREVAFGTFKQRYLTNKDSKHIDNSTLYAGSPMYYYCKGCRVLITTLPENHLSAAPNYCTPCRVIVEHGLLPEFQKLAETQP